MYLFLALLNMLLLSPQVTFGKGLTFSSSILPRPPAHTLSDEAFNVTFTEQSQAQKVFDVNTGKLTTDGSCACMEADHVKFNHDLGGTGTL